MSPTGLQGRGNLSWWTTTRIFVAVLSTILFLSLIIVYLLTPTDSKAVFWIEVLIAVAGAALVVLAVHIADRLVLLGQVSKQVDAILTNTLDRRITHTPWATGIVGIYDSLTETKINEYIAQSSNSEICFLDTFIPDPITITKKMEEALNRGCSFKFLVLNPESEQAKARAALLARQGLDYEQFKHGTNIYMCSIASVAYNCNAFDKMHLRLYDEPPVTPIYIVRSKAAYKSDKRDKLFFSFYIEKASYSNFHLEVARIGKPLFEELEGYFDRMWDRNKSKEKNLEDFLKTSCPIGYLHKPDQK